MTMAFLPFALHSTHHCGVSKREQLLVLSSPWPAAACTEYGHQELVELPHCYVDQDDVAYMSPCLHQFCFDCALYWVLQKPNCPLCRSGMTAILSSVWLDEDYFVFDIPCPAEALAED